MGIASKFFHPSALLEKLSQFTHPKKKESIKQLGIVLSGGGSRAAFQVGALKALNDHIKTHHERVSVVVGSSMGAMNSVLFGTCLRAGIDAAIDELECLWRERTFRNTFSGSPSLAFFRSLKVTMLRYASPSPHATAHSIFDAAPLVTRVDQVLSRYREMYSENEFSPDTLAIMTTVEGAQRRPLLFVSSKKPIEESALRGATFDIMRVGQLTATHAIASAALPSVLPAVEIDTDVGKVKLVDGGISENVPVDPTIRLGAEEVIVIDCSGREWWARHYGTRLDRHPNWEVPARIKSFCFHTPYTLTVRNRKALGLLLKDAVAGSNREFMRALGPTWPIFQLLKRKMGSALAYEVMSYVALHPEYTAALIERGYKETRAILRHRRLLPILGRKKKSGEEEEAMIPPVIA